MTTLDSGWLKKLESFGNLLQNNQWKSIEPNRVQIIFQNNISNINSN
jgi:hypothetical protein